MATGGNERAAQAVAGKLGMDEVRSGFLHEAKKGLIGQRRPDGLKIAMAGDGVNNAPALAAADVDIAMGTGADAVAIARASSERVRSPAQTCAISSRTCFRLRLQRTWRVVRSDAPLPYGPKLRAMRSAIRQGGARNCHGIRDSVTGLAEVG